MIQIEDIYKSFDGVAAVQGLSLTVSAGELFGLLGPNGAGKTTTLKMVAGLLRADRGRILIDGLDIQAEPERVKSLLGYIPDAPYLYEKLTGREFLRFVGLLYRVPEEIWQREFEHYRDVFRLGNWLNDRIETYSHGMRQKLVFTAALIHRPQVLLVDEPMVGLDPASIRTVKELLAAKCREGLTVLMSTHTLEIAQEICHRVGIIDRGRLISSGTFASLRGAARSDATLEDIFLTIVSEESQPTG